MIEIFKKSNIAFVGGGKACKELLKMLLHKSFAAHRPTVLGVADINDQAEGLVYARKKGIFTTQDYHELFQFPELNVLVELTGDDTVVRSLKANTPARIKLIDHFELLSLWDYIQIEGIKLKAGLTLKDESTPSDKLKRDLSRLLQQLGKIVEERTRYLQSIGKELVERERTLAQIVQGTAIPTFVINKDHVVTHWNKAMERLTGYKADAMVGSNRHWLPFYSEKRPTMADIIIDGGVENGDVAKYYGGALRKSALIDGAYETEAFWPKLGKHGKWYFTTAAPIRNPAGDIVSAIETIWDITASKLLQQVREKQGRQLNTLWAISSTLSASLDLEDCLRTAVEAIIAHLDVDSAAIYLKDDAGDLQVSYSKGYGQSFFHRGASDAPKDIVSAVALADEPAFFEDRDQFNTTSNDVILEGLQAAAYFPLASKKGVFGVLCVSSHTSNQFVREDRDVLALVSNFIALAIESAILHRQEERFTQFLAEKVKEKTEELEKSYQRLQTTEERYHLMFDADPHSIFILHPKSFEILDVNKTAIDCYGYSTEEFQQMTLLDLCHHNDDFFAREISKIVTKQPRFFPKRVHQKKTGDVIYVDVHIRDVRLVNEDYLIATTTDVTENVETEAKLIQAGKMATLGTMASGIAHEINQPLNVIQVCSDYIAKTLSKMGGTIDGDLSAMAEEIGTNVQRAAEIISHMRDFSRQSEVEYHKIDINCPLQDVFKIVGQQLRVHQIELVLDLDNALPRILADHNRLEQVFINLVSNAMDALDEKARLQPDHTWTKTLTIRSFLEKDYVTVTVADNGTGIPEEISDKIFEPFFTTKEVGKGTGLGISISYGIVRDYGGTIEFLSQPGDGTTFTLKFPVAP